MKDRHLITVDELRAAGALDVPAAWRKSLFVERDLFSGLVDDEEPHPDDEDLSPRRATMKMKRLTTFRD